MNKIDVLKNAINQSEEMPLNEEQMEQTENIRYPWVTVVLSQGVNGNALAICAEVTRAMKKAGISKEERDVFVKEALSQDYDHVLQTCMEWVNVV